MNWFAIEHRNHIALLSFDPRSCGYVGPLSAGVHYWEAEDLNSWPKGTPQPEPKSGYSESENAYATLKSVHHLKLKGYDPCLPVELFDSWDDYKLFLSTNYPQIPM